MSFLGRRMFGVAFIAFGLLQFLYGDFLPGRAQPWPAAMAGRWIFAYATGAFFVLAGAAIVAGRKPRVAGFLVAALVFAWAVTRNVAPALADHGFGTPWTALGKGIALCGGALAVVGSATGRFDGGHKPIGVVLLAARVMFAVYLIDSGIQHFLFTDFVKLLIPAWIPQPRAWTYVAGAALLSGGIGLIVPKTTRLAGTLVGLMIFTWFCILHIPRALAAAPAAQRNEWTAVFEALAFSATAFMLTQEAAADVRRRS